LERFSQLAVVVNEQDGLKLDGVARTIRKVWLRLEFHSFEKAAGMPKLKSAQNDYSCRN
jgi:hypothetical protein